MPMVYNHIDPDEREKALVTATGFGDTSLLTDDAARGAEQTVCVLKLRRAFFNEHATSGVPNPDPKAAEFARQRDALNAAITEAEAVRDRIVAETGTDVSGVMQPILDANRQKAERDHFDAMWAMNNTAPTPEEAERLQCACDRAEREASVIDNWV